MGDTPTSISAIKMNTFYSKNGPKIPFSETFKGAGYSQTFYYVVIKIDNTASWMTSDVTSLGEANQNSALKSKAIDYFIEHYLPGFYPFVKGIQTTAEQTDYGSAYTTLRSEIESTLSAFNFRIPPAQKPKVIYSTEYPFVENASSAGVPDASQGIIRYNNYRNHGSAATYTKIDLSTMPLNQGSFEGFMATFSNQLNNFPGQISLDLNANMLKTSVEKILQLMIKELTNIMSLEKISAYQHGDYLEIGFSESTRITVVNFKISGTDGELTTGFITNTEYNGFLSDPLTLITLKNYEDILVDSQQSSRLGEQSSFTGWIDRLGGTSDGSGTYTPDNALGPWNNIFAGREGEDPIDIRDVQRIEKIFSTFKSSKQLQEIENYVSDPKVRKQALQQEKAKRINAGIAMADVIDKALKFEFPLAGLGDTKEGRIINQIINQFGIQELAKEALICLTQGAGVSLSRISTAVKNELLSMSSAPMYTAPTNPPNALKKPDLGDFKAYFSISGDPPLWRQILDIILGALANAAFSIIKALADMFKYNCADLWAGDIGAMDAGEELLSMMNPQTDRTEVPAIDGGIDPEFWPDPSTDHMEHIQNCFFRFGFSDTQAGFLYLSVVSTILSPTEICKLFNSPGDVDQETFDRILEFNENYDDSAVRDNMANYSAISTFFSCASSQVDTTTLCNTYINDVVARLEKRDCPICLDEGALALDPAIAELVNIIDGGITIEIPPIDFLCPESEQYLDNPIIKNTIPNLMYTLVESIGLYMGSSIEGARQAMLEPVVTTQINAALAGALAAAGVVQEPSEFDPEVLDVLMNIFTTISDTLNAMNDPALCPDLDLSKIPQIVEVLEAITMGADLAAVITEASAEAAAEIAEKLEGVQANAAEGTNVAASPYVTYRFNEGYKNRFRYAIDPMVYTYDVGTGRTAGAPAPAASLIPTMNEMDLNVMTSDYSSWNSTAYGQLQLRFNFNRRGEVAAANPTTFEATLTFPPYSGAPGAPFISLEILPGTAEYYGSLGPTLAGTYDLTNRDTATYPGILDWTTAVSTPGPSWQIYNMNPLIAELVDELPETAPNIGGNIESVIPAVGAVPGPFRMVAAGTLYPSVYMHALKNMYTYMLNNGAFSEYKLSRLNFFKDNTNCNPENVGDLMDIDGIIDQMTQEFAISACEDGDNVQVKVKNMVRYGIVNLLIQAHLVEFVVSNIITFSAFNLDDIFAPKYGIRKFVVEGVTKAVSDIVTTTSTTLGQTSLNGVIRAYFSRRLQRPSVIAAGGIISSDSSIEIDPDDDILSIPMSTLVAFLVDERITYEWSSGDRNTIKSISNIIDPTGNRPSLDDIFLSEIVGMYPKYKRSDFTVTIGEGGFDIAQVHTILGSDFEWYPGDIRNPLDSSRPITAGAVFFSRTVTYIDDSGNQVTACGPEAFDLVGTGPGSVSISSNNIWLPAKNNTNFQKSYGLYYILPNLGVLNNYPDFDSSDTSTWVPLWNSGPVGELYDPAAVTQQTAQRLHALQWFAGHKMSIEAGTYGVNPVTMSEILAFEQANLAIMSGPGPSVMLNQILSKDALFIIANLHSMALTLEYFPDVGAAFETTKIAILNLLNSVNRSEQQPQPSRPGVVQRIANETATGGDSNLDSLMREIMLKVLRETPIAILKGLVELIDPHIAISKLIRDITGMGFSAAADAIDQSLAVLPGPGGDALRDADIKAKDILGIAFCGLNVANQAITHAATNATGTAEDIEAAGPLLGPNFSMKGVDFTGSVAGLFMAPPSPFGIIYLLLMMLSNLEIPIDDEGDEQPELNAADQSDPNVC